MENYPILIRGPARDKLVRIKAENFGEAKERALWKYRNKFVNYKYAKAMDLISARVEAAKLSRTTSKPQYIVLKGDEFKVGATPPENMEDVYGKFVNGSEDKDALKKKSEPAETTAPKTLAKEAAKIKVSKNQKQNTMATPATSKPAKKAAAKKSTPAKTASDIWHKGLTAKATTLRFSKAQWEALYKKAEENGGIQKMAHDALIAKYGLK